jgi:hypothetical protein
VLIPHVSYVSRKSFVSGEAKNQRADSELFKSLAKTNQPFR